MSKNTPGPWKVRNSVYVEEEVSGRTISDCGHEYDGDSPSQHESKLRHGLENSANARLIAAAPDLLAALTACVASSRRGEPWNPNAINAAYDAIAKATGDNARLDRQEEAR